jgi:putative acetyltransferase
MFCFNVSSVMSSESIEFKLIEPCHIQETKGMIVESIFEVFALKEWPKEIDATSEFDDLDNVYSVYFDNKGVFYVLLDSNKVVGSAGLRKIDDEICELKRMWLLKAYRGKGLGFAVISKLFEFARAQGYKKIRLDVYYPNQQHQAIMFYRRLGFYEIAPYNNSPAQLYMEKIL